MRKNLSIALTLLALIGAVPLLGACHTTAGAGKDLSATGHVLTTARRRTPRRYVEEKPPWPKVAAVEIGKRRNRREGSSPPGCLEIPPPAAGEFETGTKGKHQVTCTRTELSVPASR